MTSHSATGRNRKGSIKFVHPQKTLFFATMKQRVNQYFADHRLSPFGNTTLVFKTLILLAVYLLPFVALLLWTPGWFISLSLWLLMGFGMAGLGMSVMHDANHGAYSSHQAINWSMAHVLNLMGGSTINWKLQHNILHHTYTNITSMDDDIASKPALRLSPHEQLQKAHRHQWWHAFLLYGLTTLYWVTAKDFVQYFKYRREKVNTASTAGNRWIFSKLLLLKICYFTVMLGLPILVFHLSFVQVLAGFLLMHFLAGLILTVVFQLAHSLEGTSHPMPNEKGVVANDWAIHQMNTTMNFSPRNRWLSWYVGGLNFQVEHHLFPRISHVHYPAIAPIVRAVALEFGVPYLSHEHLATAFRSHVDFLKKLGRPVDWKEAIG